MYNEDTFTMAIYSITDIVSVVMLVI